MRGRPKKDEEVKKSVQIRVRMSIKDLYTIKRRAKEHNTTISELMREGAKIYIPSDDKF